LVGGAGRAAASAAFMDMESIAANAGCRAIHAW
jgi:hypothetical protein